MKRVPETDAKVVKPLRECSNPQGLTLQARRRRQLAFALLLALFFLSLFLVPFRTTHNSDVVDMATPIDFNPKIREFYESQGVVVEQYGEWSISKLVPQGPRHVVTSNGAAAAANRSHAEGKFTPLYPQTVVVAAATSKEAAMRELGSLEHFSSLKRSSAHVYLDQGVSRLKLMPAISMYVVDGKHQFDARIGLGILDSLRNEDRLATGETLDDLRKALSEGYLCITLDDRAVATGLSRSEVEFANIRSITFWEGIWTRTAEGESAASLPEVPSHLITSDIYPSLGSGEDIETVNNLPAFEEFIWDIGFIDQTYYGSWRWKSVNEGYRIASFIFIMLLIILWAVARIWTSTSALARRAIVAQALLLVAWILARVIKHSSIGVPERYAWYFYYVPILASILLMLVVIVAASNLEGSRDVLVPIAVTGSVLIWFLVYTNDIHHMLLRFGSGNSIVDYSYGPLYFVYHVWLFAIGAVTIAQIRHVSADKKAMLIAATPYLIGIVYTVLYTLRVSSFRSTEITQVFILIVIASWEALFALGVVQQNRGYMHIFANSRLPVELRDNDWKIRYATGIPLNLDASTVQKIRESRDPIFLSDRGGRREHYAYYSSKRTLGGHVIWQTDVTELKSLEKSLDRIRRREAHQASVMAAQYESMLRLKESRRAPQLFDELDALMRDYLARVQTAARVLEGDLDEPTRRFTLRSIKLDLGYAKRAGLLVLQRMESNRISVNALTTFLSQSCTDFSSGDAVAGLQGRTTGDILPYTALKTLEGLHRGLSALLKLGEVAAFVSFDVSEDGLSSRLVWLLDIENEDLGVLAQVLSWDGAHSTLEVSDETTRLTMDISAKEVVEVE